MARLVSDLADSVGNRLRSHASNVLLYLNGDSRRMRDMQIMGFTPDMCPTRCLLLVNQIEPGVRIGKSA
jgi:hypothetical protein